MFSNLKEWWKFSKLRFWYENIIWNLKFWFLCKPTYKEITIPIETNEYVDKLYTMKPKIKYIKKRRFEGYLYKGKIFLDNPGVQEIEEEVFEYWISQNWIK